MTVFVTPTLHRGEDGLLCILLFYQLFARISSSRKTHNYSLLSVLHIAQRVMRI